jgi:hypothetical protein
VGSYPEQFWPVRVGGLHEGVINQTVACFYHFLHFLHSSLGLRNLLLCPQALTPMSKSNYSKVLHRSPSMWVHWKNMKPRLMTEIACNASSGNCIQARQLACTLVVHLNGTSTSRIKGKHSARQLSQNPLSPNSKTPLTYHVYVSPWHTGSHSILGV